MNRDVSRLVPCIFFNFLRLIRSSGTRRCENTILTLKGAFAGDATNDNTLGISKDEHCSKDLRPGGWIEEEERVGVRKVVLVAI